jgi:hypothetical protein
MYYQPPADNFNAQCVVRFENRAPMVHTLCGYWPVGPSSPRKDFPTMKTQISAKGASDFTLVPDSTVALQLVVCGIPHRLTVVIPDNNKLGMRKTLFCKPKIGASFVKVSVKRTPHGISVVGITITNPQTFPRFQERFAELMRAETRACQARLLEDKQKELIQVLSKWPAKVRQHEERVQFLEQSISELQSILELARSTHEPDCVHATRQCMSE